MGPGDCECLLRELGRRGFEAMAALDISQVARLLSDQESGAVVLGEAYPLKDAVAACQQLRRITQVPVVIQIPANVDKRQVRDLRRQSDAFFIEAGDPERLAEKLGRMLGVPDAGDDLRVGGLELRFRERLVLCEGTPVHLTPREFDLLRCLMKNQGVLLSGRQLLYLVWGDSSDVCQHSLFSHIASLRAKLGGYRSCIISRRNYGYLFRWEEPGHPVEDMAPVGRQSNLEARSKGERNGVYESDN